MGVAAELTEARVLEVLKTVRFPGLSRDIVSFGFVKDLAIGGGNVSLRLEIMTESPRAAEGTRVVATVWDGLTHGGLGISLPSADTSTPTYYAMLALMLLTIVVCYVVGHSRFGIRLNAIREDEGAAEALGIDATRYKLAAFVLSAVFPAVAGGIQAYKVLYIDPPGVFFVQITIAMALMSMLGGKGTVIGPIVGAAVLYTAQELTWVNFPSAHLIAYGLFIIVIARFMPRGLVGFAIDRGWVRKGMVH